MSKHKDLVGERFGRLVASEYSGNNKWLCTCDCGNKKIVHTNSLVKGLTKSCGCLRREVASQSRLNNIEGKDFGDWHVLKYSGNSMWECQCSCGVIRNVKAESLLNGTSKSCGHATTGYKDFTDKVIDTWWVIRPIEDKWECICNNCGRVAIISHDSLLHNRQRKCDCIKQSKELIDIKGKKFGYLTVLEYIGHSMWKCRCDCGNISIHYSHNLRRSNNTISCGCQESQGYSKDEILDKINEFIYAIGQLPTKLELCALLDRAITSVSRYIEKYELQDYIRLEPNRSEAEKQLESLYNPSGVSVRNILSHTEIDLYFDKQKLGIEYNGIYWHSTKFKDKAYHQNKSLEAEKHGIRLIHIFEYEWIDPVKQDKIIKYLNDILFKDRVQTVYGRNTGIKEISNIDAIRFCNKYHLQNGINAQINIGCFHSEELIGVLTFGKPRFNSEYEWELIRLAYKNGIKVTGGTQKMFKYFVKAYNPKSIISYCNMAKFTGKIYEALDFKLDKITEPGYVWSTSTGEVLSRYQAQKSRLIADKEYQYGSGITEDEIMGSMGFYKIYDCGNYRFVWSRA